MIRVIITLFFLLVMGNTYAVDNLCRSVASCDNRWLSVGGTCHPDLVNCVAAKSGDTAFFIELGNIETFASEADFFTFMQNKSSPLCRYTAFKHDRPWERIDNEGYGAVYLQRTGIIFTEGPGEASDCHGTEDVWWGFLQKITGYHCPSGTSLDPYDVSGAYYCRKIKSVCQIQHPLTNSEFQQFGNEYTSTQIPFQAQNIGDPNPGDVFTWTVTPEYTTSGGKFQYAAASSDTFTTDSNSTVNRNYQSQGGRVTVRATLTAANGDVTTCPGQTVYIVGNTIPQSRITSELIAAYTGPTPKLLVGIATVQSGFQQYVNTGKPLYGRFDLWPQEDDKGGAKIGLLKPQTTMETAWDWKKNIKAGAKEFQNNMALALSIENAYRTKFPALPQLTPVQRENIAILLTFEMPIHKDNQYYAVQGSGATAKWIVNATGNPRAIAYVNKIRNLSR